MKICKVKPDYSTCSTCVDIQKMYNVVDDCSKCKSNTDTYELLQIGTGFWSGDYAIVQKDGAIRKVSLSKVYDVKEIKIQINKVDCCENCGNKDYFVSGELGISRHRIRLCKECFKDLSDSFNSALKDDN